MTDQERSQKIETMKLLIKAECARVTELLDTNEDLSYRFGGGPSAKSDLKNKMRELRKDTLRLQHLICYDSWIEE